MGHDSSKSAGGPSKLTSTLGLKSGPSNATVQRHIETAKKSRVLQLKGSGLKKIPDQLQELAEVLRHVDLSNNKLKSIPPSIGNFSSLKQLHLSENVLGIPSPNVFHRISKFRLTSRRSWPAKGTRSSGCQQQPADRAPEHLGRMLCAEAVERL